MNNLILSPVEKLGNIFFKREDLYEGIGGINGTKLRQAEYLVDTIIKQNPKTKGIVTGCSIHSPQAAIVAGVCKQKNIKCIVCYGGTTLATLKKMPMPILASKLGASIQIVSKTGRHNVIYSRIKSLYPDYGIIEYGMCIKEELTNMISNISQQVQNIPDELDNLVITCGSGFSSSSVLQGILKYGKKIKNIYLVHVAPNRIAKIKKNIGVLPNNVIPIMLFDRKNFHYEDESKCFYYGIEFHPKYEAKAFNWLMNESKIDIIKESTLFWIIGKEPKFTKIINNIKK